ncbi:MAG: type II toxin-antitoxin system RelE/ParE family toxin [Litorimonas sp.]
MQVLALRPYADWIDGLKDRKHALRIVGRVARIEDGNFGDWKSVGGGVFELRLDFGPGYRVYYAKRMDGTVVLLLGGGTKRRQDKDIATARQLAARL